MLEWDLIAFLVLSFIEVVSAIFVVTSKRLVRSVFWLGVSLITMGGIYIMLRSEFIALIQILVYAGAVPILILFGIMLTRKKIMED